MLTMPPVVFEAFASPATTLTSPPLPFSPMPTRALMSPPLPPLEGPDMMSTLPEVPFFALPVLKSM